MTDDDRRAAGTPLAQRLFAGVKTGVRLPQKLADYGYVEEEYTIEGGAFKYDTVAGAEASGRIFSLIETARAKTRPRYRPGRWPA